MNSGQLPLHIEPRKFAEQDTTVAGAVELNRLSRLADYQGEPNTLVQVELRFHRETVSGNKMVEGTVATELELTCQRCLEPMAYPVDATVKLTMVWSEAESQSVPKGFDPWLITGDKMSMHALLEDEILLSLPVVALHDECPASLPTPDEPEGFAEAEAADNPFAALAKLKQDK